MKTTIPGFVIGLILILNKIALSQSGWFWQTPYPQGNYLSDISVIDANTSVSVGNNGTFLKTSNGGTNWTIKTIDTVSFQSGQFLNTNVGWTVTYDGKFYRTTNGGNNWNIYDTENISDFYFIDENTGWGASLYLFSELRIWKTSNGGANWQIQYNMVSGLFPTKVQFADNNTGWVLANSSFNSEITKTTNGGLNWFSQTLFNGKLISSFDFLNGNTGWIAGFDGIIMKTTNGGDNWTDQLSGSDSYLYSIKFIDENTGWAVGGWFLKDKGVILRTTNGGNNWETQLIVSNIFFTKINSYDINSIWCIGDLRPSGGNASGRIFKAMNGGESWVELSKNTNPKSLLSVQFTDSLNGWSVGAGINLKTTDGGNFWESNLIDTSLLLNSVFFLNSDTGWVAGFGPILRTNNGGNNWSTQLYNPDDYYTSILFFNNNTGWVTGWEVFGGEGFILKTTDGGINWSRTLTGVGNEKETISFIDGITGWAIGGSNILKTTNAGDNWFSINCPSLGLKSASFVNSNTGWVASGHSQSIGPYKTTDGGNNWVLQQVNTFISSNINFINPNTGWLVGASIYGRGMILKTSNGGNNWFEQSNPCGIGLIDISIINESTAWVAGSNGTILKTMNGGIIVSVGSTIPGISQNYFLYQNYPNPFNPVTKIKFDVPSDVRSQTSDVKLVVFDILGKEVMTLVNEKLSPGSYETDFNGSNFASGIYFYKLEAGNFVETKRMMLIK